MLTKLGVILMVCLACVSCKKDDPTTYPTTLDGVWTGGNGSTGYTCDVIFSSSASIGQICTITIAAPGEKESGSFDGRYTYDVATGTATVTFETTTGGPSKATLQSNGSDQLAVSFTSTVDLGVYTVTKVTYPNSIAGTWVNKDAMPGEIAVSIVLFPYAIDKGLPGTVTATRANEPIFVEQGMIYSYESKKGTGDFSFDMLGAEKGTFTYNLKDGTLSCKHSSLGENAITLIRK